MVGRPATASFRSLHRGRVVQVDPMKLKLKPPGTERLKLKCIILLSTSAFKFDLRRYTAAPALTPPPLLAAVLACPAQRGERARSATR